MGSVIEIKTKKGKVTVIGYKGEIYALQHKSQNGGIKMDLKTYQQLAQRTANNDLGTKLRTAVAGLGIGGESGEVEELIKKSVGHGHEMDLDKLKKELGDVLWYVAEISSIYNLSMEDIAEANIEKLKKRYPDGFSEERSINREECIEND